MKMTLAAVAALALAGCAASHYQPPPIQPMRWERLGRVDPATNKDLYECQREAFATAADDNGRLYLHMSCMRARGYTFVPAPT